MENTKYNEISKTKKCEDFLATLETVISITLMLGTTAKNLTMRTPRKHEINIKMVTPLRSSTVVTTIKRINTMKKVQTAMIPSTLHQGLLQ